MRPSAQKLDALARRLSYGILSFAILLTMATSLLASTGVYSFTLNSIEGRAAPLAAYKGKVVLLVNVASQCGYTPQYSALEAIYEKYKDRGFVILGFPGQQLRRTRTGDERRDQNVLYAEI